MSTEEITEGQHPGAGRYCGECMRMCPMDADGLIHCNKKTDAPVGPCGDEWELTVPGHNACEDFIPSVAAMQVKALNGLGEQLYHIEQRLLGMGG